METLAQPKERSLAEYYADTLKISPLKKGKLKNRKLRAEPISITGSTKTAKIVTIDTIGKSKEIEGNIFPFATVIIV